MSDDAVARLCRRPPNPLRPDAIDQKRLARAEDDADRAADDGADIRLRRLADAFVARPNWTSDYSSSRSAPTWTTGSNGCTATSTTMPPAAARPVGLALSLCGVPTAAAQARAVIAPTAARWRRDSLGSTTASGLAVPRSARSRSGRGPPARRRWCRSDARGCLAAAAARQGRDDAPRPAAVGGGTRAGLCGSDRWRRRPPLWTRPGPRAAACFWWIETLRTGRTRRRVAVGGRRGDRRRARRTDVERAWCDRPRQVLDRCARDGLCSFGGATSDPSSRLGSRCNSNVAPPTASRAIRAVADRVGQSAGRGADAAVGDNAVVLHPRADLPSCESARMSCRKLNGVAVRRRPAPRALGAEAAGLTDWLGGSSRRSAGRPGPAAPRLGPVARGGAASPATHHVLDEWPMRPGGGRGHGITALFAGDSGTGRPCRRRWWRPISGSTCTSSNLAT